MPRRRDTEVLRHPKSGFWHYDYYDPWGVRRRGSLNLPLKASKRQALAEFHALRTRLEEAAHRLKASEAWDLVIERMRSQRSPLTINKYRDAASHLNRYCEEHHIHFLDDMRPVHLTEMLSELALDHAPAGVNSIRSTCRTLFNTLNRWGYLPAGYDSRIWFADSRQAETRRERIYSQPELQTIFADDLYGDIYYLLYLTGARSGELISLHYSNVGETSITWPHSKRQKTRTAPLSAEAHGYIESLREIDRETIEGYVVWRAFWGDDPYDSTLRRRVQSRLYGRLKKVLADNGYQPGRVHDLRATSATHYAPLVSQLVLQQIFGWRSASVASRYYRQRPEDVVMPTLPAARAIGQTMVKRKNKS